MITIKEISKEVGVSPSTVSIVLRGKADERKISEKTKNEVLKAAHRLGYRVNIAARRLRVNQSSSVMISVFMAMDRRAYMMARFMLSLQRAINEYEQDIEIVAHYYESGSLHAVAEKIAMTNCAIICNANEDDIHYLEEVNLSTPIVLFHRNSEKYCSVTSDHHDYPKEIADIFARRGHKHAVILDTDTYFSGISHSTSRFTEIAKAHGLLVSHIYESHDMLGGYRGGLAISKMLSRPDCVFSMADSMTIGLLRAFKQQGINIPEQIELISVGTENPEWQEYSSIAISGIHLPIEEMAKECLRLLFLQLDGKIEIPCMISIPPMYIPRETCGN